LISWLTNLFIPQETNLERLQLLPNNPLLYQSKKTRRYMNFHILAFNFHFTLKTILSTINISRFHFNRVWKEQAVLLLKNLQRNLERIKLFWQTLMNRYTFLFSCTLSSSLMCLALIFRRLSSTEHRCWSWQSYYQGFQAK
jgi:hypothetical protein